MGGGGGNTQNSQNQLAQAQQQTMQQYLDFSKQQFARGTALEQPAVDFYSGIIDAAKTGDYSKLLSAAGPPISKSVRAHNLQKPTSWIRWLPEPLGITLSHLLIGSGATDVASTINSIYTSAFPALASLGNQANQLGVAQSSAGISSGNAAGNTLQALGNEQSQSKAATMGFLGNLAGAAASPFTFK